MACVSQGCSYALCLVSAVSVKEIFLGVSRPYNSWNLKGIHCHEISSNHVLCLSCYRALAGIHKIENTILKSYLPKKLLLYF